MFNWLRLKLGVGWLGIWLHQSRGVETGGAGRVSDCAPNFSGTSVTNLHTLGYYSLAEAILWVQKAPDCRILSLIFPKKINGLCIRPGPPRPAASRMGALK